MSASGMTIMWFLAPPSAWARFPVLVERDPSTALRMAEWLTEAGLPDGVFQVVQGDKEAVFLAPPSAWARFPVLVAVA
jgi:acyl-CoA reductase-like NAD-dependent aldehyde dehydrogenase